MDAPPAKQTVRNIHGEISSTDTRIAGQLEPQMRPSNRTKKTLERELEWVRMSPKGRRTKSKARLSNYEKLLGDEGRKKEDKIELYIPPGPRLGRNVIDAEGVSKAFGDKLLYENLEFKLHPAGIVGIIVGLPSLRVVTAVAPIAPPAAASVVVTAT